jgi:fumarate hydratase subunit beta
MPASLTFPLSNETVRKLHIGNHVLLNGIIITGRDTAHKWIHDRFISKAIIPASEDIEIVNQLKPILQGGAIYHCGAVVGGLETGNYKFLSAGPTTSAREEPYQGDIMRFFNLKGIFGKGGMGEKTLIACSEVPGVYFHAIGGAAALLAKSVEQVLGVFKLEFGVPEAIWVIKIKDFPAVVTMDSHGKSLHETVRSDSEKRLKHLLTD